VSDRVFVEGLEVECTIGVAEWERARRQRIVVDVDLEVDTRAAAAADDVRRALDYAAVAEFVLARTAAASSRLVETLAETLAGDLLERFPDAAAVRLRIAKPRVLPGAAAAGVEISRRRGEERR
jgi:dihydroneopterin aldolase